MNQRYFKSIFAILFIFAVPMAVLFSVAFGMTMSSSGMMAGCLFLHTWGFCPMSLSQHLSLWQTMFAASVPQITAFFSLIILYRVGLHGYQLREKRHISEFLQLYKIQKPNIPLFNIFRKLFSRGILKPEIYEHSIY